VAAAVVDSAAAAAGAPAVRVDALLFPRLRLSVLGSGVHRRRWSVARESM
jgi:hypothetical protein